MKKFLLLALTLVLSAPVFTDGAEDKKISVYIANSYNPDTFGWTKEVVSGIITGFEKKGMVQGLDYKIITDTMDALVKTSETEMKKEADRILQEIKNIKPDIVITTDDDALKHIGLKIDNIPVIFNGVNGIPLEYLESPEIDSIEKPGHNITGVYQTTYFTQSLNLLKQFYPDIKTFAVITDELTTSIALIKDIEQQKNTLPLALKDTLVSEHFSKWKEKIMEWQDKVDCLFVFSNNSVKDDNGQVMMSKDVTEWIVENSKLPDTCPWAYQVNEGILVSASDSGTEQGLHAAYMAVQILNGTDPGSIPIITPPKGTPVINEKRAKKLKTVIPAEILSHFIEFGKIF
ncbi:putative ABC transporter, substrate-binding protein [Desulfonema limicola]|uniref:ABC transporter, substrate-binding protein n=1 Tax=Desulfonema limicola TaxID=45656 RepID=A0A975B8V2_9BACT|nr:ABC transporter substrate binding protein [Desulfonema limicola]QTA80807.1 putative ABC transporter, substrate-binding protein [Desulfonema limicola]